MSKKEVVFNEEIDSRINGLALGITFMILGLILTLNPTYFGDEKTSNIIRWIFIIIGALGLLVELSNSKKNDSIKGYDDLSPGIFLLVIAIILIFYFNNLLVKIISFILLILGIYMILQGSFKILYSIKILKRNSSKENRTAIVSDLIIFATKIAGLILVILQITKLLNE